MEKFLVLGPVCACLCLLPLRLAAYEDEWLLSAAHRCDAASVDRWLDAGASPNAKDEKGDTALHMVSYAIGKGDANEVGFGGATERKDWDACGPVVRRLVRARAVPNVWNDRGETPLMIAAKDDDTLAAFQALIDARAFVDARDKRTGQTALHKAAMQNSALAIPLLVKAQARLNIRDTAGDTPLHLAALQNRAAAAVALLAAGASREIRNQAGATALDVARMWEHKLVATIIEQNIKTAAGMLAAQGLPDELIERILRETGER